MSAESEVRWVPVGELGEVRMGKQLSPASSSDVQNSIPYLRVANVLGGWIDYSDIKQMGFTSAERDLYYLEPGDILLNEGQSLELVGRSAIYGGPSGRYCFQNTLVRFRAESSLIPEYVQAVFEQWLRGGVFAAIAKKTTSIAHLGGGRFAQLKFPVIPMDRQIEVVSSIRSFEELESSIDSGIEKIAAVRSGILGSRMERSGRKGWCRVPLGELVPTVDYGISVPLGEDPRGIPTLRMNNLNYGRLDLGQLRYCSHHVDGGTLLRRGDVLFNRTNSLEHVGKSAIWNDELQRATFASYLVRLNYDAERIDPRYLVEWLNYPSTRRRVRSIATVAVQQVNVNPTRLRGLVIDLPVCLDEQSELIATLDSCDARIDQAREAQSKLRKVKAGVVSRLIGDLASRWQ